MIEITIPGYKRLVLEHLVVDLNGTVALDGEVLAGVAQRLAVLSASLTIHMITADTHGRATEIGQRFGLRLLLIQAGDESGQKQAWVEHLGADRVVAIGNGVNDRGMLAAAALGIAVLGPEGLATAALQSADLVVSRIEDALDLLIRPHRLVATLRR